ncbi:MAG TPA: tagaturonate epimerase family protein [Bryobacteraceae bacterium]|nr:tagaturonate epimerase family protein [Bryobacteraceae bacterium]
MKTPQASPVDAGEAGALSELLLESTSGHEPDDGARDRLTEAVASLGLQRTTVHAYSLTADPQCSGAYYVAVDSGRSGWLLHVTPSGTTAGPKFADSRPLGRVRPAGGGEMTLSAVPFDSTHREHIVRFAEEIDPSFLPRPQGSAAAIAAGNRHPEISLPAVFDGFRAVLRDTGQNLASTVQLSATREMTTDDAIAARDGENPTAAGHTRVSIRHLFQTGLWAAIRAGWRAGYNAEADHVIITGNSPDEIARSVEAGKEAIRHAERYTKFTTDTSRLFDLRADERHPQAYTDAEIESELARVLPQEDRRWAEAEFTRSFDSGDRTYTFTPSEIRRLCVKFGPSLLLNEQLFDYIQSCKAGQGSWKHFDFEPSLDEADTLTTPAELIFYMHWLMARGRAAQLVPPNLGFKKRQAYPEDVQRLQKYAEHKMWPELLPRVAGAFKGDALAELAARISELAEVARLFNGTLSIHSGSGKQPAVLRQIGGSTGGRWNYKISGELQLQLFDVLYEQPASSPWRQLYERMVERCNSFAAANAFGEESSLATQYRGSYLGDAHGGRTDGNLFLVFWLGNIVGSRDASSPDGDSRFFKDKLDEIPPELRTEVQRRNAAYIVWLARQLREGS